MGARLPHAQIAREENGRPSRYQNERADSRPSNGSRLKTSEPDIENGSIRQGLAWHVTHLSVESFVRARQGGMGARILILAKFGKI
jgi:hypothetical protein